MPNLVILGQTTLA